MPRGGQDVAEEERSAEYWAAEIRKVIKQAEDDGHGVEVDMDCSYGWYENARLIIYPVPSGRPEVTVWPEQN